MNSRNFIAAALSALSFSAPALAFNVDGNLADWGVTSSSWVPSAGIHYTIEDQTGGLNSYLTPGYGGQSYDAEALYASISGGKLYIALATGHKPTTLQNPGGNTYGAGDFAIDFGKNGSYELGINVVHQGAGSNADPITQSGAVYQVTKWGSGLWGTNDPTFIKEGTQLGMAALAYSTVGANHYGTYQNDQHYFYEMSLDLSLLYAAGWDGNAFNIHWTENCANDSIIVDPPAHVPEPGTLTLLGLSLAGLAGMRRRRG